MTRLLYLLFLLSGAAALVYEVVWVRSLSLVFGGSHLAVTTVLATFMGGLALGGWLFGRRADRMTRPLLAYGLLELGIAASALGCAALLELYPVLYGPLARLDETSVPWLTSLRVLFATAAMIVPTTLMGGTLPVLSRLLASRPGRLGRELALLYGLNTLGAVIGTLACAFLLLRTLGVSGTTWVAVATNATIGLVALALRARVPAALAPAAPTSEVRSDVPALPARLVLLGIGISGFCALGYEVLWTRVLSLIVGTSVYGFAVMLVAFLSGIALGGQAASLVPRARGGADRGWSGPVLSFGAVQVAIGATALTATYALGRLPMHAARLERVFLPGDAAFAARQAASFVLAAAFMAVPAFFMGLAFPIAGAVHARRRAAVGGAVGEVLALNTVGAILGAAVSGFALLPLLGIERSLELLAALNVGLGLLTLASALGPARRRPALALLGLGLVSVLVVLVAAPGFGRTWDRQFLAVFRNNQRGAFDTPERVREALAQTDVLYYHEGVNETISVIRPKGGTQGFVVNGRVEASTRREDVQCQRALGHLPMLLHENPRRVFVLGLGTGMTLGATAVHRGVERITLAEIERGVFPAARTFGEYNHHVLEDPRLRIVHDDGRNFLRTTRETFDVITADPIHPWSGGASYLYTVEYFRSAAAHLAPGGVLCQWLPIYEMTPDDLRSVLRTFAESFRHTAVWLTWYDAEIVGSEAPLVLDERKLAERLADPDVAGDLAAVDMGTPRDLLSWFLLGDAGVRAFAEGGVLHTDDNLWLEFSTPRAQGRLELPATNVEALVRYRESPLSYGVPLLDPAAEAERSAFWRRAARVAPLYDRAHVLGLQNRSSSPELASLVERLQRELRDYAPARFLAERRAEAEQRVPRPLAAERFAVLGAGHTAAELEITAVTMRVGQGRGVVVFADNDAREVYAERYVDAPEEQLDELLAALAARVLGGLRAEYDASAAGGPPPARDELRLRLKRAAASLAAR